jgi:hypothetical protein
MKGNRLDRLTEIYGARMAADIVAARAEPEIPKRLDTPEVRRVLERFSADVNGATKRALAEFDRLGLIR